jgi:hypothetical protein
MDEAIRDYARGLAIVAALAIATLAFVINPMPWSPLGQAANADDASSSDGAPAVDLSRFDIPDGWAPGNGVTIVLPPASRT